MKRELEMESLVMEWMMLMIYTCSHGHDYYDENFKDFPSSASTLLTTPLHLDSCTCRSYFCTSKPVRQVKECTSALLRFAKKTSIPVLLIGHVTKSGDIAGSHVLEHIVDVVLYMEVDNDPEFHS